MKKLILASASPQRKKILEMLEIDFIAIPSDVDEDFGNLKKPSAIVEHLALLKAESVGREHPTEWVLGCDTIVALDDGTISTKPGSRNHAKHTLMQYKNSFCDVYSGIALVSKSLNKKFVHHEKTRLHFHDFSEETVDHYLDLNQWQQSSGAMTIEGEGGKLIKKIEGEYWNVVGLPIDTLKEFLNDLNKD